MPKKFMKECLWLVSFHMWENVGFQISSYSQTIKILLEENTEQILYSTMLYS